MDIARAWVAAQQIHSAPWLRRQLDDHCEFLFPCREGTTISVRGRDAIEAFFVSHLWKERGHQFKLGHVLIDFELRRVAIVYLPELGAFFTDLLELGPSSRVTRGEVLIGQRARQFCPVPWL